MSSRWSIPTSPAKRIDLDPSSAGHSGNVESLVSELAQTDEESRVAYRAGQRHVARLRRSRQLASQSAQATVGREPQQLQIVARGTSAGVALRGVARSVPGPGQVEIEVRAAGLNFRDVLNVLGVRQDDIPLGGEVAGIVSALGLGVEGLQVGDEVVAVCPGLGNYVVAPVSLVLPKPANLDFAAAAAVPLVFLTAYYALQIIGRMAPGERVLIHAAAGGVGMAAIEVARRAGLQIFATAGSQAKRDFLPFARYRARLRFPVAHFCGRDPRCHAPRGNRPGAELAHRPGNRRQLEATAHWRPLPGNRQIRDLDRRPSRRGESAGELFLPSIWPNKSGSGQSWCGRISLK